MSETDRGALKHLRYVLALDDSHADHAENEVLRDLFRARLKRELDDGVLSDAEKAHREAVAKRFALADARRREINKEGVVAGLHQAFNEAWAVHALRYTVE